LAVVNNRQLGGSRMLRAPPVLTAEGFYSDLIL
jgi:hypothetical protein